MNNTSSEPRTPDPDWIITKIEIDLEQNRIYANNRQQARIRLYLEAKVNGALVSLTPTEIASIRLIDYTDDNSVIPFSDGEAEKTYKGWSAQTGHRGYDAISTGTLARIEPRQYFDFYLAGDESATRGALTLAVSIKGDNGLECHSTGLCIPAEGAPFDNQSLDVKDKVVTAQAPEIYPRECFRIDGSAPATAIFNQVCHLSIVTPTGRTLAIRELTCEPAGMIHWINSQPQTSNPCFTGYAGPKDTALHWNKDAPVGNQPLPTLPAPEASRGVIMLCGRNDIPRNGYTGPMLGPVTVTMIDAHGNTQTCRIAFVAGKRSELEVQ